MHWYQWDVVRQTLQKHVLAGSIKVSDNDFMNDFDMESGESESEGDTPTQSVCLVSLLLDILLTLSDYFTIYLDVIR
jgi:hypothetical protein